MKETDRTYSPMAIRVKENLPLSSQIAPSTIFLSFLLDKAILAYSTAFDPEESIT